MLKLLVALDGPCPGELVIADSALLWGLNTGSPIGQAQVQEVPLRMGDLVIACMDCVESEATADDVRAGWERAAAIVDYVKALPLTTVVEADAGPWHHPSRT